MTDYTPKRSRNIYKQYLSDPKAKMPKRTQNYINAKKRKLESEYVSNQQTNVQLNIILDSNHLQHYQPNDQQSEQINSNESESVNVQLNYSISNGFELQEIEPSEQPNQTETTSSNDLFNDLNDFIRDQKVTKEDLAAAFLAAFYGNSNTQKSLKDYIDLVNQLILTKDNQLPTSFAGLISLLNGKKQKLNYEKSWYCDVCQKLINKLDNRFQRECSTCNSR